MDNPNDSDDDLRLSSTTLLALNEFLQEKERRQRDGDVFENWQLSQFWYTDETCQKIVDECICTLNGAGRVACLCCPSVVQHFMDSKAIKKNSIELSLFEYDRRFEQKFPQFFVNYDYRKPLDVPSNLHCNFDLLIADPPFLSDECFIKIAQTIRLLSKKETKLIVNTGAVMEGLLQRILDAEIPMAYGTIQQQLWAELLCCSNCGNVYSIEHLPVTLPCGRHLLCSFCCSQENACCPFDKSDAKLDGPAKTYINIPVLSIVLNNDELCKQYLDRSMKSLCSSDSSEFGTIERLENLLHEFAKFLYRVSSEKGATISSNRLSRTIQRKLFYLLCANFWSDESRAQIPKLLCTMNERIVSELILCIQSSSANLSSSLWSAVRSRGCQFLGPALQKEVLDLILLMLHKGESIARKTLVLYVVEQLASSYPHISKTCVGHVVQLLYRASCFNVIKQDGKSSLMQLKEEFRTYKSLRFEHDAQIVQIAMDFGLRISPEQWSSLLYGDCNQRKYMQSVCDRLSTNSLQNAVDELRNLIDKKLLEKQSEEINLFEKKQSECDLLGIQTALGHFNALTAEQLNASGDEIWPELERLLGHMHEVLKIYSESIERRNIAREQRIRPLQKSFGMLRGRCDVALLTNGTPLRSLPQVPVPIEFGCRSNIMPVPPLIYTPPPPPTFIDQQSFPIGTPPGFITQIPLNVTQTHFSSPSSNIGLSNTTVGSPPSSDLLNRPILHQKHLQMDAFETMPGQFIPLLPTHQFVPTAFVEPFNAVTTATNSFMSANVTPSTNNSLNGSALIAPIQSTDSPFSTSPPSYQFSPTNTRLVATPAAFPIPVQPQPVFLYGSTPPFGSPPLLISQFTNWTSPMESGGFMSGAGFYNINAFNTANTTASSEGKSPQKQSETSFESEEEHGKSDKKCRHSSRTTAEEDDSECHVSFTVATSVLHGHDESEHSFGSVGWNLELPPLPVGQLNIPIPLSPSNVTYTVACDSAKPNLCTIIRPSNAANAPTQLLAHTVSALPLMQELGTDAKLKDVPVS
ncbi:hypothetical protein niasHT_007218 [Heterodera trifolii]|uniref:RING-type E3 ubiquitin transferase n=1 Tax=Heterodera trifolii TaxID=157864 RepID=A0ABD2LLC1_9BILA